MDSQAQSKINQAISLLQSLMSSSQSCQTQSTQSIPNFDNEFNTAYQKGKSLEPPIIQLTQILSKGVNLMKKIISRSRKCKKPVDNIEQKLKNKFINLSKQAQDVQRKNRNYFDHAKAIKELLSVTFWVFVNTPEFIIKGAIQSADFNALKFQRNKNKDHNQWWQNIGCSMRTLENFVVKNYPSGLNYNFQGTSNWNDIIQGVQLVQNSEKPKSVAKQAPKSVDTSTRKPVKQMMGPNMTISHQIDTKITLGEIEIQMKNGIFVQNCKKLKLQVPAKFKSLQMNKCEGITLTMNNCISGVQLMNCQQIVVIVKQNTPSISVDKCQKVQIILNESNLNCDIVSAKASELTVTFENSSGNGPKKHLISDQLITKWNPSAKKFETAIYDKFL